MIAMRAGTVFWYRVCKVLLITLMDWVWTYQATPCTFSTIWKRKCPIFVLIFFKMMCSLFSIQIGFEKCWRHTYIHIYIMISQIQFWTTMCILQKRKFRGWLISHNHPLFSYFEILTFGFVCVLIVHLFFVLSGYWNNTLAFNRVQVIFFAC